MRRFNLMMRWAINYAELSWYHYLINKEMAAELAKKDQAYKGK